MRVKHCFAGDLIFALYILTGILPLFCCLISDFLLIVLKDLLPRRPELRLILMSATLDAELFSSYFGGSPVVHIPVSLYVHLNSNCMLPWFTVLFALCFCPFTCPYYCEFVSLKLLRNILCCFC